MKKYIFLAVSALTLASCSSDDFLGDTPGNNPSYAQTSISFGGTTGKISRANDITGAEAAGKLHNSFIVYGTKKVSDTETQTVFNKYQITYDNATSKWKYENSDLGQSIKYWDYSATQYDFVAFSLAGNNMGEGENDIKVVKDENLENPTFTLTGKVSALKSCYIADPVSVTEKDKFGKDIQFTFRSTGTKVSVRIFETIPGYNIKEIKFYKADDTETETSNQPVLYASSACFASSEETGTGTMKLTFNKTSVTTKLTVDNSTTGTETKYLEFTGFSVGPDNPLGTDKTSATKSGAIYVSPTNIEDGLTMKVDYTLISTDNSGETINVKGATVKVPKDYTNWEENHHYTYIFKITDSTNGSTGGTGTPSGLTPIVFDAIVSEELGGTHTTVTEFNKDGIGTTTPEGDTTEGGTNGEN